MVKTRTRVGLGLLLEHVLLQQFAQAIGGGRPL
jgi:hypothetical protein